MSVQKDRLDYLLIKARSAALHLGILKNHILVRYDNDKYEILMIIPGQKDPERIYSNMSYMECITFFDKVKIQLVNIHFFKRYKKSPTK